MALGTDRPMLWPQLLATPWAALGRPGSFAYDLVQRLPLLAVVCLQWCFPSLMRVTWGCFVCIEVDDIPHWVFHMQQICRQGAHLRWAASLGSIMVTLLAVGVPAAAFIGGRKRFRASALKHWNSGITHSTAAPPAGPPAESVCAPPPAPPWATAAPHQQQQQWTGGDQDHHRWWWHHKHHLQQQQQQHASTDPPLWQLQTPKAHGELFSRDQGLPSPGSSCDTPAAKAASPPASPAQRQTSLDSAYEGIRAARHSNSSSAGAATYNGPVPLATGTSPHTGPGGSHPYGHGVVSEGGGGQAPSPSPEASPGPALAGSSTVWSQLSWGSSGAASDVGLMPCAAPQSDAAPRPGLLLLHQQGRSSLLWACGLQLAASIAHQLDP